MSIPHLSPAGDPLSQAVLARSDGRRAGNEVLFRCPLPGHPDVHPSARWHPVKRRWYCDVCKVGGGEGDLAERLGIDRPAMPPQQGRRPIVKTYDYTDAEGRLLFQVVRFEPKGFAQRRPNGQGDWVWNLKGVEPVLYRLPEVRSADDMILLVEGEKDADRLRSLGLVATTAPRGAGTWRPSFSQALAGKEVAILPDNDEPGRRHAEAVAAQLHAAGCTVSVVPLPGLPEHGDVSDWLDGGFTADDLAELIRETPLWTPQSVPATRAAVPAAMASEAGDSVLDAVEAFLARFVAYPSEHARIAHALWIVHAHLMDAWEATPRLAALSPEPASGKTRLLEITALLVPNPVEAVNVTAAYLFRKVGADGKRPTILYDEIDTVFGPKANGNEEIRGLLNAGHRKGAVAGRCYMNGKTVETEEILAYCAVALAGLGHLPDTILSRSIVIRMRRRSAAERVEPYRRRVHAPEGDALRNRIAAWAASIQDEVADAWPMMPDGVEDRDSDVWEPLLAVADAAGGAWPERARVAAVALVADSKESTPSLGIRLLADLRKVFGEQEVMATEALLAALHALPEAPWEDLRGKPLAARGLARMLNEYGVKSKTIRIGGTTPRGYARADLADAWSRYLAPSSMEFATSATSATAPNAPALIDPSGVNNWPMEI